MVRTKEEIEADIQKLKEAEINLAIGKNITDLTIGSGDFQRRYSYQEIDQLFLAKTLQKLQQELNSLSNSEDVLSDFTDKVRTHSVHLRRIF